MRTLRELRARVKELETSERELTKRVSNLAEQAVRRSNEHAELMRKSHELLVRYEAFRAEVASKRTDDIRRAETEISYLRKQLAWTPVRDGLPTEPGVYAFVNGGCNVTLFELDKDGWHNHDTGEPVRDSGYECLTDGYWDVFRRIELPKEGET